MGGKKGKQVSTGLTPGFKGMNTDPGSPNESNKENLPPPAVRRSERGKASKKLFPEAERSQSKSPQKNKISPRKRDASASGDKARNDVTPNKKSSGRPIRTASTVANARIGYCNAALESPQVRPQSRTRRPVLELDNAVEPETRPAPTKPKPNFYNEQRRRSPDDSEDDELWAANPMASSVKVATPSRSTRQMPVGRNEKEADSSSQLMANRSFRTPAKTDRETRSQSRSRDIRTISQHTVPDKGSTSRRTPSRTGTTNANIKEKTYISIDTVNVKVTLPKAGEGRAIRSEKTTKTAAIKKGSDKDEDYEPNEEKGVEEEESDSEEEERSSSEEEEVEESGDEDRRRKKRQRGGRGKGGRGMQLTTRNDKKGRGAVSERRLMGGGRGYTLQVDQDDCVDMSSAPSNLAAALERLAVYRCPRGTLLCREQECKQIREFVEAAISTSGSSEACYISGVPGTGKTASVMAMVKELASTRRSPFVFIQVNAMYYTDPKLVFSEVLHEYEKQTKGVENVRRISGNAARKRLNTLFETVDRERPPVLMLIDELDQLSTKKQELIYDVFNWSSVAAARVSIISIANTLDLPERMLNQRICSRLGMNRIIFQPYTHEEIVKIVRAKLGEGGGEDVIDASAVEIAARKVAKVSGDLRKAMDILKAAIETAIRNGEKTITMQHVNEAVGVASETLLVLAVRTLSFHQKMVFEATVDIMRTRDILDFSVGEIVEKYEAISRLAHDEEPLNYDAIVRFLLQLSSMGLIKLCNPNERAFFRRRVRLLPAVHDAVSAIKIVDQSDNTVTVA